MQSDGLRRPLDQFHKVLQGIRNAVWKGSAQPTWPINPQNTLAPPDSQMLEVLQQIQKGLETTYSAGLTLDYLKTLNGYNAAQAQALQHDTNGNLTWVAVE
jgi:hypothetical protein